MSIQAPPNLTPEPDDVASSSGAAANPAAGWRALLDAGINDWGGKAPLPPPLLLSAAVLCCTAPLLQRVPCVPLRHQLPHRRSGCDLLMISTLTLASSSLSCPPLPALQAAPPSRTTL